MHIDKRSAGSLRRSLALALLIAASSALQNARAEGTFISAPSRADVVHDAGRNLLYITSGDSVLRYDLGTNSFLSPFVLGGTLKGLDLSPSGDTLVVADNAAPTGSQSSVHVVDLVTGTSARSFYPRVSLEAGTYTVAFGNDGKALVTSSFAGSGWVPLRKFDPVANTWTILTDIRQNTMITSSGDGSVIGFAESNSSGGPFGRYRVSDGNIFRKNPSGTSWFNYEIGVNRDGTQFAIPTYGGTFIYDAAFTKIATIGVYAGQQPICAAYHPVEPIVYFAWTQGTNVTAHETTTFSQTAAYNFESTNGNPGNWAFQTGRLKLSRDGSLLFSTVPNGVRYTRLYASLAADSYSTTIDEDNAGTAITLNGSIGNGGTLSYVVLSQPEHGTLSGTAPNLTYTPDANFYGTDSFTFGADYGQAGAEGTVTITVNPVEDAPVADAQSLLADEDVAKSITLSGSDAEGAALTYSVVTAPAHGTLSGTAPNLTYTPNANYAGPDAFSFKVNDGTADSAPASVAITVASVNDVPTALGQEIATDEDTAKEIILTGSDIESSSLNYVVVSAPAHGTLSGSAPNVVYTPEANYSGPDSFSFKVNDGEADSAVANVSIAVNPINDAPTATAQVVSTNEDTAKAIVLSGTDAEGNALTYAIVTAPAHGTLGGVAPNLTYTPHANYFGADSFSFKVNDGSVDSAPASVAINVASVNDAPVAANDAATTVKNNAVTINVLANDSDIDAGALTVTSTTTTPNGTIAIINGGTAIRFTPKINYTGTAAFAYTISDGNGGTANATVQVTVTKR